MTTHTFLVALEIEGGLTREQAEDGLMRMMPRPQATAWVAGRNRPSLAKVECWWVAEDDRHDGSDNDSAVYVSPGFQRAAHDLLHEHGMTPDCNDPRKQEGRAPHFEGPAVPKAPCAWCGRFVMDEMACPNAKDICIDCCGED